MPELVKLRRRHRKRLEVIGVHIGKGSTSEIAKVVRRQRLNYPVVAAPGFDESNAWGVTRWIPAVAVVDQDGRVRFTDLEPKDAIGKALRLLDRRP